MVKKSIMFVAGGTGGHIYPAIAVAEKCKQNGDPVVLLTDRRGKRFVKEGVFSQIITIPLLNFFVFFEKRQSFWDYLIFFWPEQSFQMDNL